MMYGSRDTESDRQNFFVIMGHFAPFYYPHPCLSNDPENQNFALHDNHMMYGS